MTQLVGEMAEWLDRSFHWDPLRRRGGLPTGAQGRAGVGWWLERSAVGDRGYRGAPVRKFDLWPGSVGRNDEVGGAVLDTGSRHGWRRNQWGIEDGSRCGGGAAEGRPAYG